MKCDDISNRISHRLIGYAIEIYQHLGLGMLESAYEHLNSSGVKTELLINFNNTQLKKGIQRFVV